MDKISVECIDKCLRTLKLGKACGPDDLSTENVICTCTSIAHPSLIVHLQILFELIMSHGYVPNSFGVGVIVPLVKDKTGNINNVDNYRGITLSPAISKLFEMVVLDMCDDALQTDSLQFGFKNKTGTADAI